MKVIPGEVLGTRTQKQRPVIIDDLIIDSPPSINALHLITDESCIDLNDGIISIDPFGGTPPYSFFLDGASSSNIIQHLEPGNYVYMVVDNIILKLR